MRVPGRVSETRAPAERGATYVNERGHQEHRAKLDCGACSAPRRRSGSSSASPAAAPRRVIDRGQLGLGSRNRLRFGLRLGLGGFEAHLRSRPPRVTELQRRAASADNIALDLPTAARACARGRFLVVAFAGAAVHLSGARMPPSLRVFPRRSENSSRPPRRRQHRQGLRSAPPPVASAAVVPRTIS